MSGGLVRISASVPLAQAEELLALAVELAPGGFEESESDDALTVSLYVEEDAAEQRARGASRRRGRPGAARLGGRLARVPPPGPRRRALDRASVGAARAR